MFRIHVPRQSVALGIAQRSKLTSYLVPKHTDVAKVNDISGAGVNAIFDAGAPDPAWIADAPPIVVLNGSVGEATTAVLAAARPASMTLQLFARVTNLAGTYVAGLTPEADMFIRAVTNDVRAYVIAADGTGNFLISPNALVLNSWHDFTIVGQPNLTTFYVDGLMVASIAKGLRADANPRWRLGWSAGVNYGVGLLYMGTALTADQVKQNGKYLRIAHGYP